MCEICRRNQCVSGCPNAPAPKAVYTCEYCGNNIVVGDDYYEYNGKYYHEDCFADCAIELLMKAGAEKATASEDEIDDGSDYLYELERDRNLSA